MDTPTILLTRPEAASAALAKLLNHKGYDCVIEPLLTITPTDTPPPPGKFGAVMVTSGNALDALERVPDELLALPCFCVGPRSAEKARDFGFNQGYCSTNDGAELAQFINITLGNNSARILHIAGRDIDSKAPTDLQKMGYTVTPWTVYSADPSQAMLPETVTLFRERKIHGVLVFSARTAETLNKLLRQNQLEKCCKDMLAIGLSQPIADVLKPLIWHHCLAAPAPTEEAVLRCLEEILPAS